MRPSRTARNRRREIAFRADQFVLGGGEIVSFEIEQGLDPAKIDHFWITIRAADFGLLRISINTWSLKHAAWGFDPRMRVGVILSEWQQLPASGLFPSTGLDYAELEREGVVAYQEMERPALETLLASKASRAFFAEAWGAFYFRAGLGIHQVHSRRASDSVPIDHVGRDGALRFYYRENSVAEMLLFKYSGQI